MLYPFSRATSNTCVKYPYYCEFLFSMQQREAALSERYSYQDCLFRQARLRIAFYWKTCPTWPMADLPGTERPNLIQFLSLESECWGYERFHRSTGFAWRCSTHHQCYKSDFAGVCKNAEARHDAWLSGPWRHRIINCVNFIQPLDLEDKQKWATSLIKQKSS